MLKKKICNSKFALKIWWLNICISKITVNLYFKFEFCNQQLFIHPICCVLNEGYKVQVERKPQYFCLKLCTYLHKLISLLKIFIQIVVEGLHFPARSLNMLSPGFFTLKTKDLTKFKLPCHYASHVHFPQPSPPLATLYHLLLLTILLLFSPPSDERHPFLSRSHHSIRLPKPGSFPSSLLHGVDINYS